MVFSEEVVTGTYEIILAFVVLPIDQQFSLRVFKTEDAQTPRVELLKIDRLTMSGTFAFTPHSSGSHTVCFEVSSPSLGHPRKKVNPPTRLKLDISTVCHEVEAFH
eukprot:TRINITY_DN3607_c0_g2_i5.p1 TRINITY_DN3607_c0_g2~~TRINITY_DN3607_c0_g2_i5.p1  ORF type:complete len:106 (-),score=19.81 TRINITY_DN3607_c0_g2_i5:229-546(-)